MHQSIKQIYNLQKEEKENIFCSYKPAHHISGVEKYIMEVD